MAKRLIANVLGYGLILSILSSCGVNQSENKVLISQIDKPKLVLPSIDTLNMRNINWIVINENNIDNILKENNVLFAMKVEDYEAIALNINDLRSFIQQQKIIIAAYEDYYVRSNTEFEKLNSIILSSRP